MEQQPIRPAPIEYAKAPPPSLPRRSSAATQLFVGVSAPICAFGIVLFLVASGGLRSEFSSAFICTVLGGGLCAVGMSLRERRDAVDEASEAPWDAARRRPLIGRATCVVTALGGCIVTGGGILTLRRWHETKDWGPLTQGSMGGGVLLCAIGLTILAASIRQFRRVPVDDA